MDSDSDIELPTSRRFRYVPVTFDTLETIGLADTGCNINVISEDLYNKLPKKCKSSLDTDAGHTIVVADNARIQCVGRATIVGKFLGGKHSLKVLVLKKLLKVLKILKVLKQYKRKLKASKNHRF